MVYRQLLKRRILMIVPLLALLIIGVACSSSATSTPAAAPQPTAAAPTAAPTRPPTAVVTPQPVPPSAGPKRGGVMFMQDYAASSSNFHPHETGNHVKNYSPIYNGLLEYNPETEEPTDLRGDLARSWELSGDGLTYTFTLYENATWHDGTPVSAGDVVFSMDSMVDPDARRPVVRPAIGTYYETGNSRVIDERIVAVTTKFPASEFLPVLALDIMKIVPKHWVESGVNTSLWENALGSGPFKPGALDAGVSIELEKNPDYWKEGLPYLDGMKHFLITNKAAAIAAYKTEQILTSNFAVNNLSSREALQLQEDEQDKLSVYFMPNVTFFGLLMNTTVEPFNDVKVRKAIDLALYRQPVVETFGGGIDVMGPAMGSDTWFGRSAEEIAALPGFRQSANGEKHPDDIAEARRLLAEAGFPDGFETTLLTRTTVDYSDLAQIQAQQLKEFLNIDVTIEQVDNATAVQRLNARDYALSTQGTGHVLVEPDAIISKIWMPGGIYQKWAGWTPPDRFTNLFKAQAREMDRENRKVMLREMEDILLYEDPGAFSIMYWSARSWIVNNKVKNFHVPSSLWNQMKHEHLWCDPAC